MYPVVARREPIDPLEEPPRIAAALSNVSTTGIGLVHSEEMPEGLEFDIRWDIGDRTTPIRLQVVHCRPTTAGVYRTGARLVSGVLPEEPELRTIAGPAEEVIESTACNIEPQAGMCVDTSVLMDLLQIDSEPAEQPEAVVDTTGTDEPAEPQDHLMPGVLRFEPVPAQPPLDTPAAPPGTFAMSRAFGFDKTERLEGHTTCGFERNIELRRDGNRLYLYIHSPGKKNGWGIYVDPNEFEAAFARVQEAAKSPFITTLAA